VCGLVMDGLSSTVAHGQSADFSHPAQRETPRRFVNCSDVPWVPTIPVR
jgi:hypothetical protein